MQLESLDILIAIVLIIGLARGVATGAVRQTVGFVGIIVGVVLALELMDPVGRLADGLVPMSESVQPVVGFVAVLLALQVVLLLLTRLIEAGIKAIKLTPVNRIMGAAVGVCKAALILSVVFLVLGLFDVPEQENRDESVLYAPVASVFPTAWDYAARRLPEVRDLSERFGREVESALSDRLP